MIDSKIDFFFRNMIEPMSSGRLASITKDYILFETDIKFPVHEGIPVIIDEKQSIFKISDILKEIATTQNAQYRKKSLKTIVRQKVLPSLSQDFNLHKRYENLASQHKGSTVLIIGAGDKIAWYNNIFKDAVVITSDVHSQFKPDLVFDSHQIPFADGCFDLIIAGQVLEHTFKPWMVAQEIERVCKKGGNMLIEVPFNFPYHSPPYDFFRFTYTGLRSLFPKSKLNDCEVGEGNASAVAAYNAQFLIDLFSNRFLRSTMLFISRIFFGWLKYVDRLYKKVTLRTISIPKGFSMTFEKDDILRSNIELLDEYYTLEG